MRESAWRDGYGWPSPVARRIGLSEFAEPFEAEQVELRDPPTLSEADLKGMGLPLGPRRRVLTKLGEAIAETATDPTNAAPKIQQEIRREAERRQLTVMFCDLVGSTALAEQLDPEDLRTLMQAYQRACGAVIERYQGHIAQYLGNGLMTYFGWPQAHENDAERAVRAARDIVEAIKSLKASVSLAATLQVRIGIASGLVVIGETGAGDASIPKLAVGETPNLAARVQGLAEAVLSGADLHRELQALIHRKAEGNPFFVEELVKSLRETGALRRDGEAWVRGRPLDQIDRRAGYGPRRAHVAPRSPGR